MKNNSYPLRYVTDNLFQIISDMTKEYGEKVESKTQPALKKCADDFAQNLKGVTPTSNSNTVHLKDTILVDAQKSSYYGKVTEAQVVHFGKWQIAHLLEFGWTARNGVKIERQPFIRPLFDSRKEQYVRWIKEEVEKQ